MLFRFKSKCVFSSFAAVTQSIPQVRGLPLVGNLFEIIASGSAPKYHLYIDKKHRELGPIFRDSIGPSKTGVFISDPQLMRDVFKFEGKYPDHFLPEPWVLYNKLYQCERGLFFMSGDEWLYYRRLMNKHLLKNDLIDNLKPVYEQLATALISRWKLLDGQVIQNLELELYKNSMTFTLATLIGKSYNDQQFSDEVEKLAAGFSKVFETTSKIMNLPVQLIAKLNLKPWTSFVRALNNSLYLCKIVISRLDNVAGPDGLYCRLLSEGVSKEKVTALIGDLILAAGDTTTYTTQWGLHLLAKNPLYQEKLLKNPSLAGFILKETLRLFPAAPFLTRTMPESVTLGGYQLNKGDLVLLSLYTSGHSESNFVNPESFWPERWERHQNGLQGVANPAVAIPFGIGARSCIGKRLAEEQMKLTFNKVIAHAELINEKPVDMILKLVPVPSEPLQIRLKMRK